MKRTIIDPLAELVMLISGTILSFQFSKQWFVALLYGVICHFIFMAAVLVMLLAMFFGMSKSYGNVPHPFSYLSNFLLLLQFPITHSFLLSSKGRKYLFYFSPKEYSKTLASTVFALLASIQLFLLFFFWTPTEILIWEASGTSFFLMCTLYACSWILLVWASIDAGAELQSGALGWMSLAQNKVPNFLPVLKRFGDFKNGQLSFPIKGWTLATDIPAKYELANGILDEFDEKVIRAGGRIYLAKDARQKEKTFKKSYERYEEWREIKNQMDEKNIFYSSLAERLGL